MVLAYLQEVTFSCVHSACFKVVWMAIFPLLLRNWKHFKLMSFPASTRIQAFWFRTPFHFKEWICFDCRIYLGLRSYPQSRRGWSWFKFLNGCLCWSLFDFCWLICLFLSLICFSSRWCFSHDRLGTFLMAWIFATLIWRPLHSQLHNLGLLHW